MVNTSIKNNGNKEILSEGGKKKSFSCPPKLGSSSFLINFGALQLCNIASNIDKSGLTYIHHKNHKSCL